MYIFELLFSFLRVYFSLYLMYFGLILALTWFGVELGFSRWYVSLVEKLLNYEKKCESKLNDCAVKRETMECISEENDYWRAHYGDSGLNASSYQLETLSTGSQNGFNVADGSVISREGFVLLPCDSYTQSSQDGLSNFCDDNASKRPFQLDDVLEYLKNGVEAIIEDQVVSRFEAEKLTNWNLLLRTDYRKKFQNHKLMLIWLLGAVNRYFIWMPVRTLNLFFGVGWLAISMTCVGYLPEGAYKRWLHNRVYLMCFRILARWLTFVVNYHQREYRPQGGTVCVSNHTTPFDVLTLSCDNCYSLIGQRHSGLFGIIQRSLARASPHIWFERSVITDREAVAKRLRYHVSDANNPPILIFPEGTCINNTSVMQFKKGAFEIDAVVHPVAIKYRASFGNAFWDSSKYSVLRYVFAIMSSWAIVCDVWYLQPMSRAPDESAVQFASRVKAAIAQTCEIPDLVWDGQLKRMKVKKEWKLRHQKDFCDSLDTNN